MAAHHGRTLARWLAAALPCVACATGRTVRTEAPAPSLAPAAEPARFSPGAALSAVLEGARAAVGTHPAVADCSGFVRSLYRRAGIDLYDEGHRSDNGVLAIARYVRARGEFHRRHVPVAGDIAFFDNSWDRNGDGRLDDRFTHIGIVDEVLPDGTALVVHSSNHGVVREPMNLLRPHDPAVNAVLRRSHRGPRLMGELFAGFGRVFPAPKIAARRGPPAAR